jgi:molybdate transport system permease protein
MVNKQINILTSERVFRVATIGALAILGLFFFSILLSLFPWFDRDTIVWALTSREILFGAFLSVTTASLATFLSLIICTPAAYALSQTNFKGKNVVDTFLDLPIVISPIAIGAALLAFFSTPIGAGIQSHIIKFVFQVPGIILAQFAIISGLAMRLLKSTFDEIDPQYEQVARTLGYNKIRAFSYVTLPLAKKGIIATTILIWARAVGEFGATVTLAGAMPFKTETLPIAIYLNLAGANIEKAVVVILLLIIIASIALLGVRKLAGRSTIQ